MSPLLRHPYAVPSLFSQGGEADDCIRARVRPPGPAASRLESLALAAGLSGEDTMLGRSSRALAGTTIAVFMIGLPVIEATRLIVAISFSL